MFIFNAYAAPLAGSRPCGLLIFKVTILRQDQLKRNADTWVPHNCQWQVQSFACASGTTPRQRMIFFVFGPRMIMYGTLHSGNERTRSRTLTMLLCLATLPPNPHTTSYIYINIHYYCYRQRSRCVFGGLRRRVCANNTTGCLVSRAYSIRKWIGPSGGQSLVARIVLSKHRILHRDEARTAQTVNFCILVLQIGLRAVVQI
jgi:hypothetical protein